jgi:hypothetical protein
LPSGATASPCGRGTRTSTSSGVIVLRLITAMRAGALTADIDRVAYSLSLLGSSASSGVTVAAGDDVIAPIELHHRVIADQRDVPVRAVRLDDDVVRLGMRRESQRGEVDNRDDRVGGGVDDRDLARRLVRDVDKDRRQQGKEDVHGTGVVGRAFRMNRPSVMLLTATTPLLKNG